MGYKEIQIVKNPRYLVITPLRKTDCITEYLDASIDLNSLPFDWIAYSGEFNIPTNTQKGLEAYCRLHRKPKYFIKVDNDIQFKTSVLDQMYNVLKDSPKTIAYAYSGFAFKGSMNMRFGADKFDIKRLKENNYISSVSMIKTEAFEKVGGFVIDDRLVRLLDWAMWLKFYRYGYIGAPVIDAFFEAIVEGKGVSNGSAEDFFKKKALVIKHFVEVLK